LQSDLRAGEPVLLAFAGRMSERNDLRDVGRGYLSLQGRRTEPALSRPTDIERAECYDLDRIAMAGTKITLEQVRHVARLARLELLPEQEERLRADMDEMLAYVDKLNELDTKDVAPTTQVGEAGMPMRDDEVTNRPDARAMLANAPSSERGYFKVPKIIE